MHEWGFRRGTGPTWQRCHQALLCARGPKRPEGRRRACSHDCCVPTVCHGSCPGHRMSSLFPCWARCPSLGRFGETESLARARVGAEVCLALAPGAFFSATCRLLAVDSAVLRGCRVSEEISFNHVQEISRESLFAPWASWKRVPREIKIKFLV